MSGIPFWHTFSSPIFWKYFCDCNHLEHPPNVNIHPVCSESNCYCSLYYKAGNYKRSTTLAGTKALFNKFSLTTRHRTQSTWIQYIIQKAEKEVGTKELISPNLRQLTGALNREFSHLKCFYTMEKKQRRYLQRAIHVKSPLTGTVTHPQPNASVEDS